MIQKKSKMTNLERKKANKNIYSKNEEELKYCI